MNNNQSKNIFAKFKSFFSLFSLIGIILGIIGGYIYYIKIGCSSGSCPITSNPFMSMLWGGIIGYLVGDLFKKRK